MNIKAIIRSRIKSGKELPVNKRVVNSSRNIELTRPAKIYKYLSVRESKDIKEFENRLDNFQRKEPSYKLVEGKIVKI